MFSGLRPGLVYRDTSRDITVIDDDYEAEEWEYDGRTVYRGSFDPNYLAQSLHVYSLYDEHTSLRIGIAEHEMDEPEVFNVLWFYDNPFQMLLQEEGWEPKCTIWSLMSNEAYQDCLEDDFQSVFDKCLISGKCLVTPRMLMNPPFLIYECKTCNKKSLSRLDCCPAETALDFRKFSLLFLDDSNYYVMQPPSDSDVYSKMNLPPLDACEVPQESVQEQPPPLQESQSA